jgi:site-specific DNA recombinase
VRGDFEPLVSQEPFYTMQAILSGKRGKLMPRLRSHPDFPLRRFVKCGCCDKPLTGSWSKGRSARYAYYFCPNSRCRGVSVSKADLEGRLV